MIRTMRSSPRRLLWAAALVAALGGCTGAILGADPADRQSTAASPYTIGAYYFGMFSSKSQVHYLPAAKQVYGRSDYWAGVKDFYGGEPGVPRDTRGWSGDFSHLKPTAGYYDQSSPGTLEQHIGQARAAGIGYFNFYWYWRDGAEHLAEGLHSFITASNSGQLDFMLSICAHPWGLSIAEGDMERVARVLAESYLGRPNHLRVAGRPVVFLLDTAGLGAGDAQAVQRFTAHLKTAALVAGQAEPLVLLNADLWRSRADQPTNSDGYSCLVPPIPDGPSSYAAVVGNLGPYLADHNAAGRPFLPCFLSGFDERPRQDIMVTDRSAVRYFTDATPQRFRDGLLTLKASMAGQSHPLARLATLYAWNEWHEGGILEPNVRDGTQLLDVVRDVFALAPAPAPGPSAPPGAPAAPAAPVASAAACNPATQPAPYWGVKNGQCLRSCGGIGGTSSFPTPCDQHGKVDAGTAYDVDFCCRDQGAAPSPSVAPAAVGSYLDRMYQQILKRAADAAGKAYWAGVYATSAPTCQRLTEAFLTDPAPKAAIYAPATDTAFLHNLYQALLWRPADVGGLNDWLGSLTGGTLSRAAVVQSFINSAEFASLCTSAGLTSR